ncbi:MAG: hypothetical protein KJN97_06175 [Deltaproteobacteria bacterium]|nr:hypothetical protein [Deltaproteobacteria bacterium]
MGDPPMTETDDNTTILEMLREYCNPATEESRAAELEPILLETLNWGTRNREREPGED